MELSVLPAFLAAVVLISATPGPAMALVLRQAGLHGFRAAIPTVLGLELGLFLWALAAGLGLAALVAASEVAFWVLRIVGAGVLVYLGLKAMRSGWRLRQTNGVEPMSTPPPRPSGRGAFAEALTVQLANPKAAIFLMAFYPQFLPTAGPVLPATIGLGLLQVSVELVLYLSLAGVVGWATGWFSRTAVRRRLDYLSGAVLLALGLRVALTSRPAL
ncbi:MAG: LysE family translocator [Actinobacteria bacterium]|nr:LysE family translocator [Actinomycetota bacterium]